MTRAVVFILMLIPILIYNAVKPDELSVSVDAPAEIKKGETVEVTYNFIRGDIKGFGRLQKAFPAGIELEAVETSGATFTFDNDVMKVIWLNLPKNKEFLVKLKLTATDDITAENIAVGGKLSYLVDNKRQTYTVPDKSIKVIYPEVLAAKKEAEEAANKVEVYAAKRAFEDLGNDKYKVTLSLDKSAFGGFGKIEEFVPLGATAEEIETEKAVFSFIKDKAKFVWMAIPTTERIVVSYTLDLSDAMSKETSSVTGAFSYLDNQETKTTDILTVDSEELLAEATEENKTTTEEATDEETATDQDKEQYSGQQENTENTEMTDEASSESSTEEATTELADNEKRDADEQITEEKTAEEEPTTPANETAAAVEETDTETPVEEEAAQEEESMADATEEDEESPQEEAANDNLTAGTTKNMNPDKGVSYRVQIAAGKNVVDKPYFKKRHNFTEDFFIDNHEGWVKYTTGTFGVYKQARDKREVINEGGHKFDGPFVTAYNNGARITVQEALMISNQKWFK